MTTTTTTTRPARPALRCDSCRRFVSCSAACKACGSTAHLTVAPAPVAPAVEVAAPTSWTVLAVGLEPVDPTPVLRREVGHARRAPRPAPRFAGWRRPLENAGMLVAALSGLVAAAMHAGIL